MRAPSQVLDAMDYGGGSPIEWLEGWLPAMDSWQGWALLITVLVLGNEAREDVLNPIVSWLEPRLSP